MLLILNHNYVANYLKEGKVLSIKLLNIPSIVRHVLVSEMLKCEKNVKYKIVEIIYHDVKPVLTYKYNWIPQIMEINSIKNNFPFVMYHKSWIDNMWRMLCTILEYQVYICTMVHVNVSCESL